MKNPRLGCLTPFGLAAALITLLAIAVSAAAQGGTLFSPGPLNGQSGVLLGGVSSHAEIGGSCGDCHSAPWDSTTMMQRCLVCHTAIQGELANPQALHGILEQRAGETRCLDCHTEHQGAQAELTRVDMDDFPHDATGFSLQHHAFHKDGKPFACDDCHPSQSSGRQFAPVADQSCDECHTRLDLASMDQHRQAFSGACMNCHDGFDRFSGFDHNRLIFPLENAHARLACQDCHAQQDTPAALGQTPRECAGCHAQKDAHDGAFGRDCVLCHTTRTWEEVIFDHAASRFPLTGAHIALPCSGCHQEAFRGTPQECAACHQEPDFHAGLFQSDCADCHTTDSWQPAAYALAHHFPQDHEDAAGCRDCHTTSLAEYTCYTCHDPGETTAEHQEEGITDLSGCAECHPDGTDDDSPGGGDDRDDD